MRRSSVVLALTSFYAAGTAAQSCPPQYAAVANWVADYSPAVSYCSSRYPGPTTTTTTTATVIVTQTSRTQSKRSVPTDLFAHLGAHDKPRPGHVQHTHSDKVKRQGYSWTNYYYSQMISQRGTAWVQGVCGCLVDPVTIVRTTARTITTWVAAPTPTVRTTSSSVRTSTSSIRASSSSSSSLRLSTLSTPSTLSTRPSTTSVSIPSSTPIASPSLSTRSSSSSSSIRIPSSVPSSPSSIPIPSSSTLPSSSPAAPPSVSSASLSPSLSPSLSTTSTPSSSSPLLPTSAPTSAVPPVDLVAQSGCTNTDEYQGTGACSCEYTILCNVSGNCGAADGVTTTAVDSWQACGGQCDDNSACSAWTYNYATGICTQITDEDCSTDLFNLVDDPGVSVLGVYVGSCQGTCLF
ncbi:uncharacterized protein LTHEOB_7275 [Lasiodiplodia theobromae]|nr:uncharacterized protein LTHEOB_7275 [Lasiodiplodia theobromae]KAF4543021.1 hypothetical protein LTHEOB_7275 [Lasiodiplodia theobromae]